MKYCPLAILFFLCSCASGRVEDAKGNQVAWSGTKDYDVKTSWKNGGLETLHLKAKTNPETVEAVGSAGGSFVGRAARRFLLK